MVPRFATLSRIPKGVWVLGGVSLLMDVSSEMIHSLLPLFMATTLGASVIIIGIIEGVAEATALMLKVFSGVISDYVGKRKGLALLGYGLGALSKPLFAIAPTSGVVFSARMIDRVGKGIRGAPRDALVADVTPPEIRGAAYGLRQALDTIGGCGYRLDFYPRPLQRSVSGAARPADGDPAVRDSAGDGRDEPGVQPDRLSVR